MVSIDTPAFDADGRSNGFVDWYNSLSKVPG